MFYSARNFDTSFPATSTSVLARKDFSAIDTSASSFESKPPPSPTDFHYSYSSGQHILIDIQHVDSLFLNHAGRLSQAMIDTSQRGNLQLLSVHCHALFPTGVTCVGVMLKSHITFHTWPDEGVILLDLMTFQREDAIHEIVHALQEFFGVPSADPTKATTLPQSKWALKRRGFSNDNDETDAEQALFERYVLGSMEYELKERVTSRTTSHGDLLEVYDVIGYPRRRADHERSLDATNGSYESQHADLYKPDRILLMNGVVQSRRLTEAQYIEVLVHPAMLMHEHPRKVVIVGGGTGAALREVLRHESVQSVVVIERDETLVSLARTHLMDWSNCSDLVGSNVLSCFDDTRVSIEYANGVDWFRQSPTYEYDVVILDV
ncbi:hypothetical protein MPSEU_000639100 [Mayamaea pseudoterrestris]|nr:hypothetical protein MPSEU_000639100 [Mayamaea pseudoterrestris]